MECCFLEASIGQLEGELQLSYSAQHLEAGRAEIIDRSLYCFGGIRGQKLCLVEESSVNWSLGKMG